MYWEDYPRRPRRPANGIRAATQRGQFGKTWWASRWIAALERLVDAGRLSRGRSYARSGQVVKLDVGSTGIAALVQGSRPRPYKVSIHFRHLSDAEWEKVADAMAGQAIYAAKLLSGEMPAEIEDVFTAAGTSLFPAARGDLESECSCPDWANPCKHVAAVHYLLGERFEADPFLIFELRGRSQAAIAELLRVRRVGPGITERLEATDTPAEEPDIPPLTDLLDTFWSAPSGTPAFHVTLEAPTVAAAAVKRLGPPPFWSASADFAAIMERAYEAIGAHALSLAIGDE